MQQSCHLLLASGLSQNSVKPDSLSRVQSFSHINHSQTSDVLVSLPVVKTESRDTSAPVYNKVKFCCH